MTAVVVICSGGDAEDFARAVARRLPGPAVQIPFDAFVRDWPVTAPAAEALATVSAQQAKLLVAGYVRAGFHVVLHGSFVVGDRRIDAAEEIVRLMATVPQVRTLRVYAVPTPAGEASFLSSPPHDLRCDLQAISLDDAAEQVHRALTARGLPG